VTPFVTNIDYNAKGQRVLVQYGNGAETRYGYDPNTFRLIHLYTRRGLQFTGDCENPDPPPPETIAAPETPPPDRVCGLQNLHYTYDPAGNITHIRDDAQDAIYFDNTRVEPSNDYKYDAIYRLLQATGREHLGQAGGPPVKHSYSDFLRVNRPHPGDGNAMGRYCEEYVYDAVGNIMEMIHRRSYPGLESWRRSYSYNEPSQLEGGFESNRLTSTTIGGITEIYSRVTPGGNDGYDAHGNMLHMPHLQEMRWDFQDRLSMTQRQNVADEPDDEGELRQGERTWYVYDASGQRVRKVTTLAIGEIKDERVDVGGFEIYRAYGANAVERETLHIMDDKQRIALVETKISGGGVLAALASLLTSQRPLIRYQFGNRLGSACLELDDEAQVISYEEYTPYGSTSYQGVRQDTEVPAKRYRYTGKERDEESGLYYHGERYYAAWIARWTACDPIGIEGGLNIYCYGSSSPCNYFDPTGAAPKKYEEQRARDTAAKAKEMRQNLAEAKNKGYAPDPMQDRASKMAKKRGKTPIEHHHHKGVKQAAETKLDPKRMGDPMSSVWSTKADPVVQGGIGDKPVWDPEFDGKTRTHHNIAKELDLGEQAKGPKAAKGLEDAAEASKQRLPATVDMAERAKMDWTPSTPKGPPVDPHTGRVLSQEASLVSKETKLAKAGTETLEKAGKGARALAKLGKAGRHLAAAVPILGVAAGQASATYSASQGDYVGAALDEAGFIPVAGDLLDAARGGYALGEAANELLVNEDLAMKHGEMAKAAMQTLGAGETLSNVVGGLAAAGSALGQVLVKTSPVGFLFW
jgi:RHS repeat-associated protein